MSDPRYEAGALEWGSDLGNPIALLKLEPEELGGTPPRLDFVRGHDDLDTVLVAVVRAPSGRNYTLVRHLNSPSPGTEVLTRLPLAEAAIIAGDLRDMLHALGLGQDAVGWVAPAVVAAQQKTSRGAVAKSLSGRQHHRKLPARRRQGTDPKSRARASLKRRA